MDTDDLDFFLLDIVSEFYRPPSIFVLDRAPLRLHLNHDVPAFTRPEVISALLKLQAAGDVCLLWNRRPGRPVNAEELDAGVLGALPLHYGLTAQGGERWARLCAVDWSRWVDIAGSYLPDSTSSLAITTGDPYWTAFWLEIEQRWNDVIPESVVWEEVRPWRPVYWHEEAVGYRASYRTTGERAHMPPKPYQPVPQPSTALAPRRERVAPVTEPPLRKLSGEQLEQRASKGPRKAFAAMMEQARRETHLSRLYCWLDWRQPSRCYAAARELGRRRDAGAVDRLLEAVFSHGDVASVEALGQIGDPRCLEPLTTLFAHLSHQSAGLVDTIGRTIAGFGETGVTALLPFADRERGIQALRHTRSERAVEAVRARFTKHWQAVDVLESMGVVSRWRWPKRTIPVEALRQLEEKASQADWKSRYQVAMVLHDAVDPGCATELRARLREDPDTVVRGCARLWGF